MIPQSIALTITPRGHPLISFSRVTVLCEIQTAWSRIWTQATIFIPNDNNTTSVPSLIKNLGITKILFTTTQGAYHHRRWGLEYAVCIPCKGVRHPFKEMSRFGLVSLFNGISPSWVIYSSSTVLHIAGGGQGGGSFLYQWHSSQSERNNRTGVWSQI